MSTIRKTNKTRRSEKDDKPPTKRENADKEKVETYSCEAKAAMRKFVTQIVQNGIHSLRLQYAEIKTFVPADPSKKYFDANQGKCRYKDVPCWDKTRVVLTWPPNASNDFLHANWVTHPLSESQFICCQGPLDATVGDFWRCVWQEKVKQIVMLCRCQELGKDKCAQYWPLAVGDSMGHYGLIIKCEKVDSSDRSFVHTKLQLTYEKEVRNVDHRQWITWPDKSVPKTPMAPFRLLQFTRKSPKHPTIIHCSAGVGRTGTLVAVELVYQSLVHAKVPDIVSIVKEIRSQRSTAVQTEDQYIYIHYAILQLFHIKSVVPAHFVRHFIKEYETYLKLLNDNGGKNLPMQATCLPNSCAKCVKIAAHLNEVPKEEPPPELKQDSKIEHRRKKKDESDYEKGSAPENNKDIESKKEKGSDAATKKEKKGCKNNDEKSKILRKLKDKNKEKEKTQKGEEKKNNPETPVELPPQLPFSASSSPPPLPSLSSFPQKPIAEPTFFSPMIQNVNGNEINNNEVKLPPPEELQMRQNPNVSPFQLQQPNTSAEQNIQQPQLQIQQPSVPAPSPTLGGGPIQNDNVVAQPPPQPNPAPFQYKPPATYVIKQAGDKNAVVYKRNNAQPYIKAIAAPPGQIQPKILVNMNGESTPQPSQTPPPSQTPSLPPPQRIPGVPFFENNNPSS